MSNNQWNCNISCNTKKLSADYKFTKSSITGEHI